MPTDNRELLYFVVQVSREPRIRITEVHDLFYACLIVLTLDVACLKDLFWDFSSHKLCIHKKSRPH